MISEPIIHFQSYRLESLYRQTTAAQRAEAVAFWLRHGALVNRTVAEQRSWELVYLVRYSDRRLVGIATVSLKTMGNGKRYYAYRMFLDPQHRVPYLMWAVTDATRAFLNHIEAFRANSAIGLLIMTENPKLMRPGMRKSFRRHGYRYAGKSQRGQDLWLSLFVAPVRGEP